MNRKAQITIFIIVAVLVIGLLALFFLLRGGKVPFVPGKPETNLRAFMASCVEDEMRENINKVLSQGGFIDPKNYHMFNDFKVSYLCYNVGKFEPCINQYPMFLTEISQELKEAIFPEVENCFNEFESSLKKQGYEIELGDNLEINVSLAPKTVSLNIIRDIIITKSEETTSIEEMRLPYSSSLYELVGIANQIANEEAKFCSFDCLGYMNLYPEYLVLMKKMSDSTKVYYIKDKKTEEQMNIAIRGCGV